jgi:uncharacterized protein YecE (DUF72 family)
MAKRPPSSLPLFPELEKTERRISPCIEKNKARIEQWSRRGILFGTSSWKYPGWKGQVYNRPYPTKKSFQQECLSEYAELFPTVCADFALYDFPKEEAMGRIYDTTGEGFKLSLKVTDRITVKCFPNIPRYGPNAGKENPDFLNVELFEDFFLKPIEKLKGKRGAIIFEFSTFHPASGIDLTRFTEYLAEFFSRLPKGYQYAVEVRNEEFLTEDYLKFLRINNIAHVLNSWTRMPSIVSQLKISGTIANEFSVIRALLTPGRAYQQAVEYFQPYDTIKEENPELRDGITEAIGRCLHENKTLYVYVNNRAEGNAPKTIEAILDNLDSYPPEKL